MSCTFVMSPFCFDVPQQSLRSWSEIYENLSSELAFPTWFNWVPKILDSLTETTAERVTAFLYSVSVA